MMFFFLNAKFWDDWMLNVQMTSAEANQYWKSMQAMFPTNRFIEISLLHRNAVAMHLLIFLLHFLNGVLIFAILKRFRFIKESAVTAITLIFLVLPINSARVAMVNFRYTYSLTLFLLGWYLLVQRKFKFLRLLSVGVFIASFIVQSLLVFLIAPCIHLFLINYLDAGISRLKAFLYSAAIFLVAPCYFVVVRLLDPPASTRAEYFTPSFGGSAKGLFFVLISAVWMINELRGLTHQTFFGRKQIISIGVFLISIGSFAYMAADNLSSISEWMLNFVPGRSDWDSRHQLLMGLGLALVVVGFLGEIQSRSKKQLFSLLLVGCVGLNFIMMQSYFVDWRKSVGFISAMSEYRNLSDLDRVMVIDTPSAEHFNARGRSIRTYEWEAMLSQALGGQQVKVVNSDQILCWVPDQIIPQSIIQVSATADPKKTVFTGDAGIAVMVIAMNPCQ